MHRTLFVGASHPDQHLLTDALVAVAIGFCILFYIMMRIGFDQWAFFSLIGPITFATASSFAFAAIHGIRWLDYGLVHLAHPNKKAQ